MGSTLPKATVDDLRRVAGDAKAELVSGKVVLMSPTGGIPGRAGGRIYNSLDRYEQETGLGYAFPDNVGFLVDLPDRQSFSPDAAFFIGAEPDMQFPLGAPAFAAEVRSENDYGPQAERAIAAKRADYFAAGTQVVWDVDLLSDEVIRCYRADAPDTPRVFHRGEIADAEPALPGWRFPVDDLFPPRRHPASSDSV
jgi:Uma2 family endonuclease